MCQSLVIIIFGLILNTIFVQGKITCFDEKKDIDGNWIVSGGNYQYVEDSSGLPSSFSGINLDGKGIWFIQGSGSGKEIKLTIERKVYSSSAKNVQIYIRYYDKSPRSMSLYPVKGPLPLVTLPTSSSNQWTEVRLDLDAKTPVEISAFLSAGHVVAFEKIVLAVDSNLPQNASAACQVIASPSSGSVNSKGTLTSRGPVTSPVKESGSSSGTVSTTQPVYTGTNTQCVAIPPTECKCNCNCNCNKC